MERIQQIKTAIRDVPDFPKPGILFKDITPLLNDPKMFSLTLDLLQEEAREYGVDIIAGIESRGFIFGAALADRMNCGFVPIRKPGKLPAATIREEYALEYGSDAIEIHADAFRERKRVLLLDDLLATGGTAEAAAKLVEKSGGHLLAVGFVIELEFLTGVQKLSGRPYFSLIKF